MLLAAVFTDKYPRFARLYLHPIKGGMRLIAGGAGFGFHLGPFKLLNVKMVIP